MGFLDKLWDETLAGPKPESGLGKLRKLDSFSTGKPSSLVVDNVPVSRSITILRTHNGFPHFSSDSGSESNTPSGCYTPGSPFSPRTPREDFKRLTRKKGETFERDYDSSSAAYDWFFSLHENQICTQTPH